MIPKALLKTNGRFMSLLHGLPVLGDPIVRGMNRVAGRLAFHAPVLGGKKGASIGEVREGAERFLRRAGIAFTVTGGDEKSFRMEVERCPYGFCKPEAFGVCDAAMDLDRTYIRLLGGELVIEERLAGGSDKCRFTVRLLER